MKTQHAVYPMLVGVCLYLAGALMKILHLAGANILLVLANILLVTGGILLVVKLLTHPKEKS